MTRTVRITLLSIAAGLALAAADAAEREPDGGVPEPAENSWHVTSYVGGRLGFRTIDYWSKGPWMRAESVIKGHPVVTIVRSADYFIFDRISRTGVRIARSPTAIAEDAGRPRPFGNDFEELVAEGGEKVEEALSGGRMTEIWRVTTTAGRRKLWITHEEPRLPLRLETFVRASSETVTLDYGKWTRGIGLPDAFFAVPETVALEQFGYEAYIEASSSRAIAPVLYPDLLHGSSLR